MTTFCSPISEMSHNPVRRSKRMIGVIEMIEYIPQGKSSPRKIDFEDAREVDSLHPEFFEPIRKMPHFSSQRSRPGFAYMASLGRSLKCESQLEFHYLMEADFNPNIVGVSCQPMRFHFNKGNKVRKPVPDIFVRFADGHGEVWNVKPDRMQPKAKNQFADLARICAAVGWDHWVKGDVPEARLLNLQLLAGFRSSFPMLEEYSCRVLDAVGVAGGELPLGELLAISKVPAHAARPTVYTMLWDHLLETDLSIALQDESLVTLGGGR